MSLTSSDQARLEKAIGKARRILEADLANTAEGKFGLHRSGGRVELEDALSLSAADRTARQELVGVVKHLQRGGSSEAQAVARLLREASFTTLNRLVAIRVAEAIGLVPQSLGNGRFSEGFREVLELVPLLADDPTGGYWVYLRLCADELARDAPVLFDPRNPLLALSPSAATLDELIAIFSDPALAELWAEPETFGWTYQYFNRPEERREMRESAAPRNSRELAVRNQFFTPRYVVDFLVHNTLGRRILDSDPASPLREELPFLVSPPEAMGEPISLDEVRVLDPAVGSGHFLLGCYDVLERAWELKGVTPKDAAATILPCLWGIDIDPRCTQVTAAALMIRARRRCPEGNLPQPNITTARPLPEDPQAWEGALAGLDRRMRGLVKRMQDALETAPVLGPLLKVEEALRATIEGYHAAAVGGEGRLFSHELADVTFAEAEASIRQALERVAAQASSTAAERLLAAEASEALRFVEAVGQRYDAVLMNPPFGEPVPETKVYLKASYPWIPSNDSNLMSAFVGRGLEFLKPEGYLGAITSRAALFLGTFERWRGEVLLAHEVVALADLGFGIMEGALVEAAAYVLAARGQQPDRDVLFLRLVKDIDRSTALMEATEEACRAAPSRRVYRVSAADLAQIPGKRFAYSLPESLRRLFTEFPALEGSGADVRRGSWPGDDFRYLRLWWEVDAGRVGRRRGWVNYVKGGEYSPFYAEPHLLVAWDDDRRTFKDFFGRKGRPSSRPENLDYYFRLGVTWPRRTTSGFSPRVLPRESVFADKGPSAFPSSGRIETLLAWLNSRLVRFQVDSLMAAAEETASGTAAKSYEVGVIQQIPWPGSRFGAERERQLVQWVNDLVLARARMDEFDETTRRFVCPSFVRADGPTFIERTREAWDERESAVSDAIDCVGQIERCLHNALELDPEAERYLDEEHGRNPAAYPRESVPDLAELSRLYETPIEKVIDEVLARRGGARAVATKSYFLDRRLEILAHVFERHPSVLVDARKRLALLPPEEPRRSAEHLISYLVGCAFGRWDVCIGRDPSLAPPLPGPFDRIPICPPGMVVGPEGLPSLEAPSGYPLALPGDRLLLDEAGHIWDLVAAVRGAAGVIFGDSDEIVAEVENILGRELRDYVRRQFFKDHLHRYSKSRRKAPIYWSLSVPSRDWGIWLYAPALSREQLYAVAREARRKEARLAESVQRLSAEQARAEGRDRKRIAARLAAEEDLAKEVAAFRAEADRLADLGWKPDLDDGIILCAAPLANLFPAWPDASKERENIRVGKYPWAAVSHWADVL